jgi:hypothetical protein
MIYMLWLDEPSSDGLGSFRGKERQGDDDDVFSIQQHRAAQGPYRGTGRARLNYIEEYTIRGLTQSFLQGLCRKGCRA